MRAKGGREASHGGSWLVGPGNAVEDVLKGGVGWGRATRAGKGSDGAVPPVAEGPEDALRD
jgi:hypothetical protein